MVGSAVILVKAPQKVRAPESISWLGMGRKLTMVAFGAKGGFLTMNHSRVVADKPSSANSLLIPGHLNGRILASLSPLEEPCLEIPTGANAHV